MFNGRKVIDVHGHVSAPMSMYTPLLSMLGGNMALPSLVKVGPMPPILPYDMADLEPMCEYHLQRLDERQIDVQLLGPRTLLQFGWLPAHIMDAYVELTNDLIEAQCKLAPDRFLGAAMLPQQAAAPDAHHMIHELDRCVLELGFVAAYLSPDPTGKRDSPGLNSHYWDPLFERAVQLDIPLVVHASSSRDPRAEDVFLGFQIGVASEQFIASESLMRGHVFEHHPELRLLVCYGGGSPTPYPESSRGGAGELDGKLFFDTCSYDPIFLEAVIRQRGAGNMCFGTEVPSASIPTHIEDGKRADDLVPVIDGFDWLSEAEKDIIFHDNALRFCPALARLLDGTAPSGDADALAAPERSEHESEATGGGGDAMPGSPHLRAL